MAKTSGKSVKGKSVAQVGAKAVEAATSPAGKIPMELVLDKARQAGLALEGFTKKESIIRAIQIADGFQACFGTSTVATCGQAACCWRDECQAAVQ